MPKLSLKGKAESAKQRRRGELLGQVGMVRGRGTNGNTLMKARTYKHFQ